MADLITLDDYKLLEGINSSDNDEKFEFLLNSVSQLVRNYCGTQFDAYVASPGITESFDIQWDTHIIQLTESPVIAVDNVYERSAQTEAYTELFKDGVNSKYEWYYDSISESIIRTTESGGYKNWPCGVGSIQVSYTAGYSSTPADLQLAVADLVTYYYKNEHKSTQTMMNATSRGQRHTAVPGVTGLPDHIRRVLDMYRNV